METASGGVARPRSPVRRWRWELAEETGSLRGGSADLDTRRPSRAARELSRSNGQEGTAETISSIKKLRATFFGLALNREHHDVCLVLWLHGCRQE